MVSKKGYWDMINDHVTKSDLEYLEDEKIKELNETIWELKNGKTD